MKCPVCNNEETKVIDSRASFAGYGVRRRRECLGCGFRFTTSEAAELLDLTLIKSDGRREPYVREKLEAGLRKALEKRPVDVDTFRNLIGSIERDIQRLRQSELSTREIGEVVMTHLKDFDSVAYIRFASVYRAFQDVRTFQEELDKLMVSE
ncbi:hypothetical protein AMJ57_01675 [Parcubacteria bacterium SG8_24]|nr:MAG: hypothetical protein AMJ57_01675 [Parcubacteria bacterium SG8_24]